MLGSANAPEPGFHPGALGSWHASGVLACAGGLWHALGGVLACAGGVWRARGLARAGDSGALGFWHALGVLVRWGLWRMLRALARVGGGSAFPGD